MVLILGVGWRSGNVAYTRDQWRRLKRFYGYDEAQPDDWQEAGAGRNLARHIEEDGARLMAALAPHLETGKDPVLTLLEMMRAAGLEMSVEAATYLEEGVPDDEDFELLRNANKIKWPERG